jgi:dipeptidase E
LRADRPTGPGPAGAGGPIVAIGGADFGLRDANGPLHDYVLGLAPAERPRICLLPTAGGDSREQIASFHAAMGRRDAEASVLSLFRLEEHTIDPRSHLLAQDVIYVGGGNMVNLMALWREHGLGEILVEAHRRGVVLCGYSAGSMCWFEQGVSKGAGRPVVTAGLGLIAGSHCVHYSQHPDRRAAFLDLVGRGEIPAGLALDDQAAALFRSGRLLEAVRSRSSAGAWLVRREGGVAVEEPLTCRHLPAGAVAAGAGDALEEMRDLRRRRAGGGIRTRLR